MTTKILESLRIEVISKRQMRGRGMERYSKQIDYRSWKKAELEKIQGNV